jgi:hypothetical protein
LRPAIVSILLLAQIGLRQIKRLGDAAAGHVDRLARPDQRRPSGKAAFPMERGFCVSERDARELAQM